MSNSPSVQKHPPSHPIGKLDGRSIHARIPRTGITRPTGFAMLLMSAFVLQLSSLHGGDVFLDIPPRLQWNANDGYCGETSFISAGLAHGQYCSQYVARSVASPGIPQSLANSQLLLDVNDQSTAAAMRLEATAWAPSGSPTALDFLQWVKSHTLQGHIVIIGVFTNEFRFYGDTNRRAGDPQYDHIVPVVGIQSDSSPEVDSTNYLVFSDNGLWNPRGKIPPYLFSYPFSTFPRNRVAANAPKGPVYSLDNQWRNYGIAITGVSDLNGDTVPVRLQTSTNAEFPVMKDGSNQPPAPSALDLTVIVTLPDPTVGYILYQYDQFENIPVDRFNAQSANASGSWLIPPHSGSEFVVTIGIQSNQTVAFRAVATSAP